MTIEKLYDIYLAHPSIRTDTRQLQHGDLFFALKGPNFNGNAFAAKALEQGAAYAVIDEDQASRGSDRLILVPDVLIALQQLALHHRRQFNIPFIAITGSNGKTTTKELIHAVLSSTYTTYTTKGNLNNHIGIPLTILSVGPDAQLAVIEMGANHQKEIEAYCSYTLPTHGIITNVGKAHLEGFGGPEGVKKGKGELYDFLRSNQVPRSLGPASPSTPAGFASPATPTGFVLSDSADLLQMSRGIPQIITYGTQNANFTGNIDNPASPSPANASSTLSSTDSPTNSSPLSSTLSSTHSPTHSSTFLRVNITSGAATGPIQTQLVGDYNLPNVLVAVAIGKHFGVPDAAIRQSIEAYAPSNSRSQLIEKDGNHIILDAYNANPSSMRAAIENFAGLPVVHTAGTPAPTHSHTPAPTHGGASARDTSSFAHKVLILGAMAELGEESLAEHRAIVDLIARYPWQQVVLVGGDFRKISHPYLSFANSKEAGHWLTGVGLRDTYILIKGSRSTKMEEVLEG
jgi:UDP-N-acetylmuramoyl-tripeptide--D-alanyl-D-alanine ligase